MGPRELDVFTKKVGFPVGSTMLIDEVGFDVGYHVGKFAVENFGDRLAFPQEGLTLLEQMMEKGFLGKQIYNILDLLSSCLYVCGVLVGSGVIASGF